MPLTAALGVNIGIAAAVLVAVPFVSYAILAALRRDETALITAVVITGSLFSVAVSAMSATRIPITYQGVFACLPISLLLLGNANTKFQRSLSTKIALASFSQANMVAAETGATEIISSAQATSVISRSCSSILWSTTGKSGHRYWPSATLVALRSCRGRNISKSGRADCMSQASTSRI
jgi:hypothetical protein